MKKIYLHGTRGKGKFILVDDENFEYLSRTRLYMNVRGYAQRQIYVKGSGVKNRITIVEQVHRILLNPPKNMLVDHINRNKLDCRKENLRIATASQNAINRNKQKNNTSGFRGVSWKKDKKLWKAYLMLSQKQIHLGYFKTKTDAALIYNKAAKKYFGEFAVLNLLGGLL